MNTQSFPVPSTGRVPPPSMLSRIQKWIVSIFVFAVVFAILYLWILSNNFNNWAGRRHSLGYAGEQIAGELRRSNSYPTDGSAAAFTNILQQLRSDKTYIENRRQFFDPEIWTVINNLPENPPGNLIVLATRNVDPLSLRTRISTEDMSKRIQFVHGENLPRLGPTAVLIRADGGRALNMMNNNEALTTYEHIYGGQPFDCATNSTSGLPVSYLMPDGRVVVPDND